MPAPAGFRRKPRAPDRCRCGVTYRGFRTGLDFMDVRRMMYHGSEDSKEWRYRTRRMVLGFWHELKLQFWYGEHGGCFKLAEEHVHQWVQDLETSNRAYCQTCPASAWRKQRGGGWIEHAVPRPRTCAPTAAPKDEVANGRVMRTPTLEDYDRGR